MGVEADQISLFTCNENQHIDRARLIPVVAQRRAMVAVCLQGEMHSAKGSRELVVPPYWSEVFLYDVHAERRHRQLPILTTPWEFMASPGPGIVTGLSFIVPGQFAGLRTKGQAQAMISADLSYPEPIYSYPVPIPAVKNVRFEEAVDLHGLGHPGIALASSNRPPMIRDRHSGWRMLDGRLRPHRLYAARPNILIGLGTTSSGAGAAVAWRIDSPFVLHAFGRAEGVTHAAVSTSGELVALGGPDGVSVHRVTGEEVTRRMPVQGRLDGVLIDDSGTGIHVFCVAEHGIAMWEATRNTVIADFPAADEPVIECRLAPMINRTRIMLATRHRVLIRELG